MANQNEGCSCGHNHEEEHGHGGCCGHHGHGGCHHAKDQIGVFKVGPLETNCYIYVSGNECMIIDAGASGAEIAAQLLNLELKYIVATHGHADHVGGVKALKLAVPGAQYLINEADNELAQRAHNSNEIYDDAPGGRCSLCWNCTVQNYGNSWSHSWRHCFGGRGNCYWRRFCRRYAFPGFCRKNRPSRRQL